LGWRAALILAGDIAQVSFGPGSTMTAKGDGLTSTPSFHLPHL